MHAIAQPLIQATVGALLALGVAAGVVTVATAPPDSNPADQQILVYGR